MKVSNFAVEQTAGSRPLAAAAHRGRSATASMKDVETRRSEA